MKILPLMLGIMLFFTQCEKEASDKGSTFSEDVMTLKSDCEPVVQTLWAGAGQNNLDNGTAVGTVTATLLTGNQLRVEYEITEPGFSLTEVHLWVGDDKSVGVFPRQAAPGRFPYKANLDFGTTVWDTIVDLDFDPSQHIIYISAHGVVVDGIDGVEGLETVLPMTATFSVKDGAPNSYLLADVSNAEILDGLRKGWCLNPFIVIDTTSVYNNADVYTISNLPAGHALLGGLENPENLELVNYIINNIIVGDVYTYTDIQQAIWELLFSEADLSDATATLVPAPDPDKVDLIKSNALAEGFNFLLECNDKVAIILFKAGVQPVVIEYPVPCGGSDTVWAFGDFPFNDPNNFIARKWGWIFHLDCRIPN